LEKPKRHTWPKSRHFQTSIPEQIHHPQKRPTRPPHAHNTCAQRSFDANVKAGALHLGAKETLFVSSSRGTRHARGVRFRVSAFSFVCYPG
jgi:hypothetical protein